MIKSKQLTRDIAAVTLPFDPSLACKPLTPSEQSARDAIRVPVTEFEPVSLFAGATRRNLGQQDVTEAAPDATKWLTEALGRLCQSRQEITSDDLQAVAVDAPVAVREALKAHPSVVGAVIGAAARSGRLRDAGITVKTKRDSGQARRLVVWIVQ